MYLLWKLGPKLTKVLSKRFYIAKKMLNAFFYLVNTKYFLKYKL